MIVKGIVYQEDTVEGWDKRTIEIAKDKELMKKYTKQVSSGLTQEEVDEVYSDLILELYKSEDYNICKAASEDLSNILSIDNFIKSKIKKCVQKVTVSKQRVVKYKAHVRKDEDGEEDVIGNIPDTNLSYSVEDIFFDLEDNCKLCEHSRYSSGADMFLITYISLRLGGNRDCINKVFSVLGIQKNSLVNLERSSKCCRYQELISAVVRENREKAIETIGKYVYGLEDVSRVIDSIQKSNQVCNTNVNINVNNKMGNLMACHI